MTNDTPGTLSPAELAAIRSWYANCGNDNLTPAKYLGMVLSHIAALEAERAPAAVPCDREALGQEAWTVAPSIPFSDRWDDLQPHERERLCRIGDHLYQMGHAAGAASRQGEIDALRVQLLDAIQDRDDARQEAEEAEQEKRVMAEHLVAARAEVERERSRADEMCATEGERARTCERLHAEIARLTAELAAERAKADRRWTDQDTAMRNAARSEGAREEREAIVPLLIQLADAIRARAQGPCPCYACDGRPVLRSRMYLCTICGNKRCPRATDHRNECTGSNEPGQPGSDD